MKKKAEVETKKEYVVQPHPVVEELKSINLEEISPIEALNKLYEMKKMLM
jgi:DNA mismatch repair ATPase MutS